MISCFGLLDNVRKKNFAVGDLVKITLTKCQYRAKIESIDVNVIKVQNIDFGYHEFVESNSVFELSDDLLKV